MNIRLFASGMPAGILSTLNVIPAMARQVTGTPGSSGATTIIDGRYL